MSIHEFKEIHFGRDGGDELNNAGRVVRRYSRVYRAITTSAAHTAVDMLNHGSCPNLGATYPWDPRAFCRRRRARNESFSKKVWIITAAFSTEKEIEEDPLADPAEIEWGTDNFTRPFFKDINGDAILTAAGLEFDPSPEGDDSRWGAVVTKNVADVPSWLGSYRDATNSDAFTLDGYPVGVRMAKMSSITIGKWQERNDVAYRVLAMQIQLNEDNWLKKTLNAGFYEIASPGAEPTHIEDGDGNLVTDPWPLDADGKKITIPTPSNATYIESAIYKEKVFGNLPLT